ncbi:MAG: DUF5106 domain-containing protein, partial [Bacteroidales bacterium]|nr:DUF5106 domain-containing protein [Bacteroidales bacterium]
MKKSFSLALVCCLAVLAAAGCGRSRSGRGPAEAEVSQEFPLPTVPAVVSSQQEAAEYIVNHYWNRFLDEPRKGAEDTSKVCGFTVSQFNEALSQYAGILGAVPLQVAARAETALLEKVGEMQRQ